jgi:hypothetical protein
MLGRHGRDQRQDVFDIVRGFFDPHTMDAVAFRLLEALDMWEDGVRLMRENLRRRFPQATDEEVAAKLTRWLEGPDEVDPNYRRVEWPRRRR